MHRLTLPMALSCFLLATPAQAFFDEIVVGMTSVSNNLIHSGESVTKHSISTTSTTVLVLSHDIGKMADKIGLMADRIGVMADRIVLTEAMMAMLLELHYDKKEILEAYLNEVFVGQDGQRAVHGFGLASQFFFGHLE